MKDANYGCKDEGNDDGVSGQSVISQSVVSQSEVMIVHTGYYIWDSACLYLAFAKPNLIVNTDLLIIL